MYGDEKLVRGSGLFVGETGVAANHHFLAPRDGSGLQRSYSELHLLVAAGREAVLAAFAVGYSKRPLSALKAASKRASVAADNVLPSFREFSMK
jgi:hypothetical protein